MTGLVLRRPGTRPDSRSGPEQAKPTQDTTTNAATSKLRRAQVLGRDKKTTPVREEPSTKPSPRPCCPASRRNRSSQAVSGQGNGHDCAEQPPANGSGVQRTHAADAPGEEAAECNEYQEAEVHQHHCRRQAGGGWQYPHRAVRALGERPLTDPERSTPAQSRCYTVPRTPPGGSKMTEQGARQVIVRTTGPASVIATVCSMWAAREPLAVRRVQPSGSVR